MPEDTPTISKSLEMFERAKGLIPAGTMLLSKNPDLHAPDKWPGYYKRAWGCKVEDLDGNVYTDMSGDIGATLLGRADPDVNAAVHEVVDQCNFCSLNYPGEIELAELLTEIVPCAEMVRFVRGGGEADVVAIRIARGFTGRALVAFCGYHGWHDWYISANLGDTPAEDGKKLPGFSPSGVPRQLADTALPFEYNNLDSLKALLESRPNQFAAIMIETTRFNPPVKGFLEGIRELADKHGVVLIFDEVVTGFRMALGGAQEYFGVTPDMATFAKTISNGYPMGAVVGRREVMETVNNQFISSTYWTDAIGTAAALAAIKKIRRTDAINYVWLLGKKLMSGMKSIIESSGISATVCGWPPFSILTFQHENDKITKAMKTFYVRRMLERGFLAIGHNYLTVAHTDKDIEAYLDVFKAVMQELVSSIGRGSLMEDIDHKLCRSLFKRLA